MRGLLKLLITTLAILVSAYIVPGVVVPSFWSAVVIASVLAVLNIFFKPIFIVLTLPVTIFSFGLFLLFINTFMILIADWLLDEFSVGSFWNAFLFSLILWTVNSLFDRIQRIEDKSEENPETPDFTDYKEL